MDNIFLLKLILSFIIGGFWITLSTIMSEKFGTKIGGAIAGIPSTSLIALFFIGWTQSPAVASESTSIIPIVVGIDALFLVLYAYFSRFNFYFAVGFSIISWFIIILGLVYWQFNNFIFSLIGYAVLLILSYYVFEKKLKIRSTAKKDLKYSLLQLLFRGILSGTIIMMGVWATKISPLFGGAFAAFPAAYLSAIILTYLAHGVSYSLSFMKSLMVSSSINVIVYVILARYSYIYLGLLFGTLISFSISLISAYVAYLFIDKHMS